MRGLQKIGKQLLRKMFLLYFFIVGLLFTGNLLSAQESVPLYDESLQNRYPRDENPFLLLNDGHIIAPPAQGWGVDEINDPLASMEGIGGDDNALGEEEVPVGDGFSILLGFSVLFIIYRLRKQLPL